MFILNMLLVWVSRLVMMRRVLFGSKKLISRFVLVKMMKYIIRSV